MSGASPQRNVPPAESGAKQPDPAANQSPGDAKDIDQALQIIGDAHREERALTDDEERELKRILLNLGTAREHLAEIAKRLARGPADEAQGSPKSE